MKPEDLEKAPKIFVENIRLGYSPEYFVVGLSSGTRASIFSLTPQHAKRLQQYLAHEIAAFEKEHGVVKAEWNPKIVSPIQKLNPPSDLS